MPEYLNREDAHGRWLAEQRRCADLAAGREKLAAAGLTLEALQAMDEHDRREALERARVIPRRWRTMAQQRQDSIERRQRKAASNAGH